MHIKNTTLGLIIASTQKNLLTGNSPKKKIVNQIEFRPILSHAYML